MHYELIIIVANIFHAMSKQIKTCDINFNEIL